jgi:hypothetical protein
MYGVANGTMSVAYHSRSGIREGFVAEYWCGSRASVGCTDPAASNFDPAAIIEDGSCFRALAACDGEPLQLAGTSEHTVLKFNKDDAYYNLDCAWTVVCENEDQAALLKFTSLTTNDPIIVYAEVNVEEDAPELHTRELADPHPGQSESSYGSVSGLLVTFHNSNPPNHFEHPRRTRGTFIVFLPLLACLPACRPSQEL